MYKNTDNSSQCYYKFVYEQNNTMFNIQLCFTLLMGILPHTLFACNPCDCTDAYIVLCSNVQDLPVFTEHQRRQTALLDVRNSNMTSLPAFARQQWPVLDIVTLWNNTNLSCEFNGWIGEILVENYDCLPQLPKEDYTQKPRMKLAYRLQIAEGAIGGMIPTSIMLLFVAIIRIMHAYQRRNSGLPLHIRHNVLVPADIRGASSVEMNHLTT